MFLFSFVGNRQADFHTGCNYFAFLPAMYEFQLLHILDSLWCRQHFGFVMASLLF